MDEYTASDDVLKNADKNISTLLIRLLHMIAKDKGIAFTNERWYSNRISSASHVIMSSARPRSFLSLLHLAVATTFCHRLGSKNMI